MRLTAKHLADLQTENGGYTSAAMKALTGLKNPFSQPKGWLRSLVGTEVSEETYQAAYALRNKLAGPSSGQRIANQKEAFWDRLQKQGYATYQDYIASDHWKATREWFLKQKEDKTCFCCGIGDAATVHHKSYQNLCFETMEDLVLVCSACHFHIHAVVKEGRCKLIKAHKYVRKLKNKSSDKMPII